MAINKKIVIGILVAVIFGLTIGLVIFQKGKVPPEKEVVTEKEETIFK